MNQSKPISHGHPNVVYKLYGRCTSTPFTTINHNKIWVDFGFKHCLNNRKPICNISDAKLKSNGLTI